MSLNASRGGRYDRPLPPPSPMQAVRDYLSQTHLRTSTKPIKPERFDPPPGDMPRIFFPARYEENGVTMISYSLSAPAGSSSSEDSVLRDIKGRPILRREALAATTSPTTRTSGRRGKSIVRWSSKSSTESRPRKSALRKSKTKKKSDPDLSAVDKVTHTGGRSKSKGKTVTFAPDVKEGDDEISVGKVATRRFTKCKNPPDKVNAPTPRRSVDEILAEISDDYNDPYKSLGFSTYTPVDTKVRKYLASRLQAAREKAAAAYEKNESEKKTYSVADLNESEKTSPYTPMRSAESLKAKISATNAVEAKQVPSTSGLKKSGDVASSKSKKGNKHFTSKYANVKAKVSTTMNQAELRAHYYNYSARRPRIYRALWEEMSQPF